MRLLHDNSTAPPIFREATMDDIVDAVAAALGMTPGVPVGSMAYQDSDAVAVTGGTISGITALDVYGRTRIQSGEFPGLLLGADAGLTTITDATTKAMVLGLPHYTLTEEPVCGLIATSGVSSSSFIFGGGNGVMNAATTIDFYTATNNTTLTGTRRARIDAAGNFGIGLVPTTRNNTTLQIANGIGFPAAQVASSDANTLDDYEEGTFTPTIIGTTTAGAGTYSVQLGQYTKIGNVVEFALRVGWTAHTGTGNMAVTGLPFVAAFQSSCNTMHSNLTLNANSVIQSYISSGGSRVDLAQVVAGGGAAQDVALDTVVTYLYITGHYFV
jgi:hypothetical protein